MKSLSEMTEREYFASVGRRPGMFVGRTSFHMLTAFLTGYDQHALRHDGHGLTGWHDWLIARRGRDCNHAWPGQVLHIALPNGWDDIWNLPPEDEQHAIKVLFELLDEFAAECEAARGTRFPERHSPERGESR
ncbi:hypothetical protein ACIQFU_30820 [Streptomyces sp. NPDC093065]|uniref:hypothetical protein n=1 Tax=Streptomyces sp. NPDC093065 TaxID=3366021 RepID=UPI00381E4BCE